MGVESIELDGMLQAAGIPKRASYRPHEVMALLAISARQFAIMCEGYEPGPNNAPLHPATLNSFMLRRERRVSHDELAAYLIRNNTHTRMYKEPEQMGLFD